MPTPKTPPYPRRPELDAANARMRHNFARLGREAARHQGDDRAAVEAALAALLAEAISTLDRLAAAAAEAEDQSPRNQATYARHGARMERFKATVTARTGRGRA
ncbi:hypothetical protein ABT234_20910 [Streptomyces sp. NPDC001586]|uniref:hypothetical protein n=1 Tax=Streptomyces sp. NPDC001586 TaxID=3154387 RepID=UPI0033211CB8